MEEEVNRPEAAESWCPTCLDWTLRKPGQTCLWCEQHTVSLEHEQPSLVLPMGVRYPSLAEKLQRMAELVEPRSDSPANVRFTMA